MSDLCDHVRRAEVTDCGDVQSGNRHWLCLDCSLEWWEPFGPERRGLSFYLRDDEPMTLFGYPVVNSDTGKPMTARQLGATETIPGESN